MNYAKAETSKVRETDGQECGMIATPFSLHYTQRASTSLCLLAPALGPKHKTFRGRRHRIA